MAVFGHVMGSNTDWGPEAHHSDYENYVNARTESYNDDSGIYLSFDGSLDNVTAYEAALLLAYDTTFDVEGQLTCVWMDSNYDWSDSVFRDRCGESLNHAVNLLTDVLHTLYATSNQEPIEKTHSSVSCVDRSITSWQRYKDISTNWIYSVDWHGSHDPRSKTIERAISRPF